jgi:glycosyltransferase involved in cell wall biosynthesis
MGLRTTTLAAQGAESHAQDWYRRLEALAVDTEAAVAAADPARLAALFEEAAGWSDRHRSYQACKALCEATLATPQRTVPAVWMQLYATAAAAVLDRLAAEPAEPVLLNYAGVFLYELAEAGAAEALFAAAVRLDPRFEQARTNRNAARGRRRGRTHGAPGGTLAQTVRALAARARELAPGARPAEGLTLSLCMIVKDEEEMLPGCLEAAAAGVDEIVVVDTGSSDRTVEIAESFGAKVVHFPWNGSFADARNVSIEHATGDWIVYLDADEHLDDGSAERMRALLGKTWREAFYLVERNLTGGDDSGESVDHLALRMWRNRPQYRFEGRIHEQKTASMPNFLAERFEQTDVQIIHYGYLASRHQSREKSKRNVGLLEQQVAERGLTAFDAFNLGSEYMILGDVVRARDYLERSWELLTEEPLWPREAYAPMLVSRLATARRSDGDRDAVREVVEHGLKHYPDHTDLVFTLALCAVDERDWAAAEVHARRCLELGDAPPAYSGTVGSGTYLALSLVGQLLEAQGRPLEAEEYYHRALAEHPAFAAVALSLAQAMFRRGATPAEVEAALPRDRPGALLMAASACHEAGHSAAAADWFARILRQQPENDAARVGAVEALLAERRYDDAVETARGRTAGSPVEAKLALAECFVHALRGHPEELAAALADAPLADAERALLELWHTAVDGGTVDGSLPADALPVAVTFLEALLKVGEFDAFEQLHGLYARIEVDAATRSELLAAIYFRRGFLDSAADEWIASFQTEPAAGALLGLAHVASAKGLADDALAFCTEALALEPESTDALALRDALIAKAAA